MFRDLFNYDPQTGLLTWKVSRSVRIKIGDRAGSLQINHKGKPYSRRYLHVRLAEGTFLVHRIIYEMMIGTSIPRGWQIDHRDGDGTNNRWTNLRICSPSQNMGNRDRNRTRNRNLPKGIGWHPRDRAYVVRIAGRFVKQTKSLQEAMAAYHKASRGYFGEFGKTEIDRIYWEESSTK